MNRTENTFFRKTRKNAIVKQVREQYIRSDIPCLSEACQRTPPCHKKLVTDSSLLSAEATHYLVPDVSVASRYLEILEQDELSNLIIAQTVMVSLEQHDRLRTYRRLRQVIGDPRRRSVFFYNEIFSKTHVARLPGEGPKHRDWRALCKMAEWYRNHLNGSIKIIVLSEQFTQSDLLLTESTDNILVCSVKQYLDQFWPGHTVLHDLMASLENAVMEEDLEKIRVMGKIGELSRKSGATELGYKEYGAIDELKAGVKSQTYFQGVLRVSPTNRDQAYISGGSKMGRDILISGNQHRNRAVHGDIVVVELLAENSWIAPATSISYDVDMAKADEELDQQLARQSSEVRPTGRVVGVITRNWRSYVTTVQEDAAEQGGSVHLVIPLDPVIPKIRIRHGDVREIMGQRIVVRIDSWPVSSQYPNGHYVRSLGPIHQLGTEISAILVEHEISVSQATQGFSEASLREMPVNTVDNPWKPDPGEILRRRDLRTALTLFSIDPPNCQDIDDAMSIRDLRDGTIELGVHIADVGYFVKENSQTDLEARARGTTVYLADRRFDMLPTVLSERVCSLRSNVDRFAVSVIWTLDQSCNILSTWFGRTVIRSTCEMEYEQAQQLLDGVKSVEGLDQTLAEKLRRPIVRLAEVLRVFKKRRFAKGALELESSEVKFRFNEVPKDPKEIHKIVEEAMILANASVAERIYQGFKDSALLRRHPSPVRDHFKMLEKAAKSRGLVIDYSSNRALAESLATCAEQYKNDREFIRLIKTMATMAMSEAAYMSTGAFTVDQYHHYGLALEFYTHFTSPIRRYADVVVHRQLLACVEAIQNTQDGHGSLLLQNAKISEVCDHLNRKTRESKLAQRDSTELFQALYILERSREGPVIENGVVSEIRANGFMVFVPRFGIKGPVYLRDKDGKVIVPVSLISGEERDDSTYIPDCTLTFSAPTSITVQAAASPQPITLALFDGVRVSLRLHMSHAHRHSVYMTLVGLQRAEPARKPNKIVDEEMVRKIEEGQQQRSKEEVKERGIENSKVGHDAGADMFRQTEEDKSAYDLLERFRRMGIIEVG